MAYLSMVPGNLRDLAEGMDAGLVRKLPQAELNARLAEAHRIRVSAEHMPAELYPARLVKARQVRDALPYAEFREKVGKLRKSAEDLPGTGAAAREMRESLYAMITGLKQDNPYPDGMESILCGIVNGWNG